MREMWKRRREKVSLLLAVAFSVLVAMMQPGSAQAVAGAVDVIVVDGRTNEPIGYASVRLYGSVVRIALAGPDGRVHLESVPSGTYTITAMKTGFNAGRVGPMVVRDGTEVIVTLGKPLKLIGQAAATVPSPAPTSLSDTDPRWQLANNAEDLLSSVPGIDAVRLSNGGINVQQFGVAQQTGVRVDDLHLGPPGTAVDLRTVPLGLFDTASARNDSSQGDLGGIVQLGLPEPTIASAIGIKERISALSTEVAASVRGTSGNVGYAIAAATDESRNPLDGKYFVDQTGAAYGHLAGTAVRGVAVKARVPFGLSNVISATALLTDAISDDVCQITANTPCGYGGGAQTRQGTLALGVRDAASIGAFGVSASVEISSLRYAARQPAAAFLGVLQPLFADTRVRTNSADFALQAPSFRHHSVSLSGSLVTIVPSARWNASQLGLDITSHRYVALRVSDNYTASSRDSIAAAASLITTDIGRAVSPSLTVTRRFSRNSRLSVRYSANALGFPQTLPTGFSAPSAVGYDCGADVAIAQGPGSTPVAQPRLTDGSVLYDVRGRQFDLSIAAFHRVEYGMPVTVTLDAAGLADPSYLALLNAAWSSAYVCGSGTPRVLLQEQIVQNRSTYDGSTTTVRAKVGSRGLVVGTLNLMHAYSRNAYQPNNSSVPGASQQLPGVPIVSGTLTGGYAIGHNASALASLRFIGRNDPTGRGGTTIASLGGSFNVPHGVLSLTATNISNAGTSSFVTFGPPRQLVNGGAAFGALRFPLAPRTITLAYRTSIGAVNGRQADRGESLVGQSDSSGFELRPFPSTPPSDALALTPNNPECGPERAAVARRVFDAVRRYVQAASHNVSTGPDDTSFAYRSEPRATVLIAASHSTVTASLMACGVIHGGTLSDMKALQLYVPSAVEQKRYQLVYSARAGLYVVAETTTAEQRINLRRVQQPPKADPFAVDATCPADRLPAAKGLLAEIRSSFATDPPSMGKSFRIVRHSDTARAWYEVRLGDPALFGVIISCADVAAAARDELHAQGVGGADPPAINYSEALGLYVVQSSEPKM